MTDREEIQMLIEGAIRARETAYAPHSGIRIGALVVDEKGRVSSGVNVENSSFGLTVCAERNAIAAAVLAGMTEIRRVVVASDAEEPVSPCGACRQVIAEFATSRTEIVLANLSREYAVYSFDTLLPHGFSLKPRP